MMSLEQIEACIERVRDMAARSGKPLTDEILAKMREDLIEQYEGYGLPFVKRQQSGKGEGKLHSLREDGAREYTDLLLRPLTVTARPGHYPEDVYRDHLEAVLGISPEGPLCNCGRYQCPMCELKREYRRAIDTEIERRKQQRGSIDAKTV